jgi:hypothetical protein
MLTEVDRPVLTFDNLKKQLIYSFIGRTNDLKEYVVELRISVTELYRLERVIIYVPQELITLPDIVLPSIITTTVGEQLDIPVFIESNNTPLEEQSSSSLNFSNSKDYLDMLQALKVAREKGCC